MNARPINQNIKIFWLSTVGHSVATGTCEFRPKTRRFPLGRAPTYMRISRINQPSLHIHPSQQPTHQNNNSPSFISHSLPTN